MLAKMSPNHKRISFTEPDDRPLYYSAPQNEEDIICPGSDTEQSPREVKRKRERYEAHARRVLKGRIPILLSAGLQGPFDRDWINPWRYQLAQRLAPETEKESRIKGKRTAPNKEKASKAVKQARLRDMVDAQGTLYGARSMSNQPTKRYATITAPCDSGDDISQLSDLDEERGSALINPFSSIAVATGHHGPNSVHASNKQFNREIDHSNTSIEVGNNRFEGLIEDEQRTVKRPADSQWLKGAYLSKRARWDSPPASSPITETRAEQARRKVTEGKSLLSRRLPALVSAPKTPWEYEAQPMYAMTGFTELTTDRGRNVNTKERTTVYTDSKDSGMQSKVSRLPPLNASLRTTSASSARGTTEEFVDLVSLAASSIQKSNTLFDRALSSRRARGPQSSLNSVPHHIQPSTGALKQQYPEVGKEYEEQESISFTFDLGNGQKRSRTYLSPNPLAFPNGHSASQTPSSNRLPRLAPVKSEEAMGDVSFVTEVAPSSRDLEKLQFRKRRKTSKGRSSMIDSVRSTTKDTQNLIREVSGSSHDDLLQYEHAHQSDTPSRVDPLRIHNLLNPSNSFHPISISSLVNPPSPIHATNLPITSNSPKPHTVGSMTTDQADISRHRGSPSSVTKDQSLAALQTGTLLGRTRESSRSPSKSQGSSISVVSGLPPFDFEGEAQNYMLFDAYLDRTGSASSTSQRAATGNVLPQGMSDSRTPVPHKIPLSRSPHMKNRSVRKVMPDVLINDHQKENNTPIPSRSSQCSSEEVSSSLEDLQGSAERPALSGSKSIEKSLAKMSSKSPSGTPLGIRSGFLDNETSTQSFNTTPSECAMPVATSSSAKSTPRPKTLAIGMVESGDSEYSSTPGESQAHRQKIYSHASLNEEDSEVNYGDSLESSKLSKEVIDYSSAVRQSFAPIQSPLGLHSSGPMLPSPTKKVEEGGKTSSTQTSLEKSSFENHKSKNDMNVDNELLNAETIQSIYDVSSNQENQEESFKAPQSPWANVDDAIPGPILSKVAPHNSILSLETSTSPQNDDTQPWNTVNAIVNAVSPTRIGIKFVKSLFAGTPKANHDSPSHSDVDARLEPDKHVQATPETSSKKSTREQSQGWQPFVRPATPSLPDSASPFSDFGARSASPSGLHSTSMSDIPSTQVLLEATTKNPWQSAMKTKANVSMKKAQKRVSWLPSSDETQQDHDNLDITKRTRKQQGSSPVIESQLADSEALPSATPTKVKVKKYSLMRHSFSKLASSPAAVDAQAKSFIAADAKISEVESDLFNEAERRLESTKSAKKSAPTPNSEVSVADESPCSQVASASPVSRTIDYDEPEEMNFDEFLGEGGALEEWSVDLELKKASSVWD